MTLSVVAADGTALLTVDSPNGQWGEEWLLLRAGEVGGEVLEIRPLTPEDAPGRYRLSVTSRLPAPLPDHRSAEEAVTEAGRLHHEGTREARPRARALYQEALAEWQALGRDAEAARTLFVLAILSRQLDEPREALKLLRRALAGWRDLGDRKGEAQALTELATTARLLGESEGVEELSRQALDLWRELGDLHGQARTLNHLGLVRARTAPHEALRPYEEALELYRRIGDALREGVVLNNLGGIHDLLGEPRQALARFRQALDVYERLDKRSHEAAVWNNVASVDRRSGRLREALDGYNASLAVRRELGDRRGEARVLNNLGLTWLNLGDAARARDLLRDALVLRRETQDRRGEAFTLHNLGLARSLIDAEGRSREGFLRLPEIYNLELDADLVVLSGCRTALGPQVRGEGLVGLTRGFFAAGGRRVVASLWRVQDRSTAELMDRFYRRLLRDGERPAAALRAAQLEMLADPELADPYYWAAFVVYGDWR